MRHVFFKSNSLNIITLMMFIAVHATSAQESIITFEVGSFSVTLLSERQNEGNKSILVGATDEMLKQAVPNGVFPMATNVFLVETGDKVLLFDAGLGRKTIENLELYGKKASDVDAVFITHAHGDHIGSLLLDGAKGYPNATIYISKPEYDYYMNDVALSALPENRRGGFTSVRNIFNAYKDKLVIFNPNEITNATELLTGVRGIAAYGHTPGHVGYLLESDGKQILMWGDLTHAMAIQMPFPEVAVSYDSDTSKAVESRQKLLKYIDEHKILVAGAHIPTPGIGRLAKDPTSGYRFTLLCGCEGRTP